MTASVNRSVLLARRPRREPGPDDRGLGDEVSVPEPREGEVLPRGEVFGNAIVRVSAGPVRASRR